MKIYEIVAEKYYPVKEERLDEFLPIIAGLSMAGVISAITVVLAAMSFADIIKFLKKYNEDPSKISQDQWNDLFLDVLLLAIPGVAKLGKPLVIKMLPRKLVAKGGKWLNAKVSDLWKKKNPKFNQAYRQRLKQAKIDYPKSQLAQRASRIKFKAGEAYKDIVSKYDWVVSVGGSAYYIKDYYENVGLLEAEWEEWKESVKNNTPLKMPNRFADMSYSEAEAKFDSERNTLLGKASLGVITSAGFALRFLNFASGAGVKLGVAVAKTGGFTGVAVGGSLAVVSGLMNGMGRILAAIVGKSGVGLAARTALIGWLETTKEGQIFQQTWVVQALFSGIGWVTDKILALLKFGYEKLQQIAAEYGIKIPDLPSSMTPGGGSRKPDRELKDKEDKEREREEKSRKMINGIQVTNSDGTLTSNPAILRNIFVQDAIDLAKSAGKPHPLAGIPRKPGVQYPEDLIRMY